MRLASLCYNALRFAGVTTMARRLSKDGVVLCYHNVVGPTDDSAANQLGLHMPLATFERQMRWLAEHYAVVPLEEFVARLSQGGSLRGVAALTFDDGYAGVFEHAWPVLRDLGTPATVFVVADAPGRDDGFWWDNPMVLQTHSPEQQQRWLTGCNGDRTKIVDAPWRPAAWCRPATWRTIATAAAAGLHIGVHSSTHRSLPTLPETELYHEIVESRDIIRRRTGVTPVFFAYPYGLWNERVRQAVHAAGYRAAFTLASDHAAGRRDAWALPRINVPAGIDDAAFQAWTAGLNLRRHSA